MALATPSTAFSAIASPMEPSNFWSIGTATTRPHEKPAPSYRRSSSPPILRVYAANRHAATEANSSRGGSTSRGGRPLEVTSK